MLDPASFLVTYLTFAVFAPTYVVGHDVTHTSSTPEIPSFLKICHRSDPQLNDCVKSSVESLKPYLKVGIPALHIPPCEPLSVPEIELSQAAGPVSVSSKYSNIRIWGGSEFTLKSVKIDFEKDRTRLKLLIPRLKMISNYSMTGRILMLPIVGEGQAFGNFTNTEVVVTIQGERYRNATTASTHFRVLDFYCDLDVGNVNIHLNNLFNGDETLSDAMNLFLNDNWKTVAAEMKPELEQTVSSLFKRLSNRIYSKYSLDTLLPP